MILCFACTKSIGVQPSESWWKSEQIVGIFHIGKQQGASKCRQKVTENGNEVAQVLAK